MKLSLFIRNNIEAILQEWDQFAHSIQPYLDKNTLRDHAEQLLIYIAADIEAPQSKNEQIIKSKGHKPKPLIKSAADKHGMDRFVIGFIITEVIAEYRFMRATVIRLWSKQHPSTSLNVYDLIRFNEALDEQIFESVESFHIEHEMQMRQLDTMLSSTPDHNYILGLNGKFIYANKPMLKFLNLPLNELVGKSHSDLTAAAEVHKTMKKVIETAERLNGEMEYTFDTGEKRQYEYICTPVLDDEKKLEAVAVAERDITERNIITENLRMTKEQLQTLNNELEQRVEKRSHELQKAQAQYLHAVKLSAIGQLSASIAHEFNNPLQGTRTILKGLKRRALLDEEDKELLDLAIVENERMGKLIKSLRDFNQPSAGEKNAMDIHAALDSLLLLYKSDFKRKKIATELNYAEGFPLVEVVPDQIKQVFLNLLNNAKDACSKGGVITISTCAGDQSVAVAIKDNGVGFAPEKMDEIFKPFYTTKPKEKGTGLGLSISKEIIEYHQGEIRVESQPGEGSTFTILLPVKKTSG
ncbi:MAG: ATP-binding protein [Desulforhopalus sp.]